MTYEVYHIIFLTAAALCGVMFVTSVLLFFLLHVPKLIADLSGASERKAIQDIRRQNEQSSEKTAGGPVAKQSRGKLTDKMTASGRLLHHTGTLGTGIVTAKIRTQELPESGETTVLQEETGNETTVLTETVRPAFAVEYEITFVHSEEWID